MSHSVCDRGIALVREQIVEAWHLRQDTLHDALYVIVGHLAHRLWS